VNWLAYIVLLWIFLGLEKGLRDALALGSSGVAPSFVFIIVTMVAIYASPLVATWAALVAGFCIDLLFEYQMKDGGPSITLLGPNSLAYVLSVQLILALRGLMFRRNPLSLAFLSGVGSATAFCIAAGLLSIRVLFGTPIANWSAGAEMVKGLGSAAYTAGIALTLAIPLMPVAGWIGLPVQQAGRFGRRA
jgi:cell shape-determining protein MreD